ncbi:MAG: radical SAM protein [Candidatus Omnitrophota bacterium]|nr:radical SAM protein [Candidatus Omnitrophota bacterium]
MLRCKMCYIWNIKDDKSQETTMEEKKKFVKSLRGMVGPDFEFHLSGGEPLMTEGVLDLVSFIADEGYKTNMVTNGFLIDEKMAEDVMNSKLGSVTISLDGINPDTHDYIRGVNGSYSRIMEAIEYLDRSRKDKSPKISMLTVIMERNLDELLELAEWVQQDKRLEMISFQAINQPFCEDMDKEWFRENKNSFLWPQDKAKTSFIMERLRELRLKGNKIGNHHNHFLHFREYFKDPNTFLKKIKCNLGDYEFHVDPYGKMFFCSFTDSMGNIKKDDINKIWYSPETKKIRQDVYNCRRNCHIMINCFYEDEACIT